MASGGPISGSPISGSPAAGGASTSGTGARGTGAAGMAAGTSLPPARFSAQARLRALQADIMDLILERELEAGDPLPTENELSAVLGVGRNTLRESLKVLQALGVIEIRHGLGMFVAPNNFDALADGLTFRGRLSLRHHGQEALQLMDVRQALESGLIAGAMDLMTPERLAAVEESVLRMETLAGAGENFVEADAEFHRRLFEPLNNELLVSLLGVFWKVCRRLQQELGAVEPGTVELGAVEPGTVGSGAVEPGGVELGEAEEAGLLETAAVHRRIYEAVASGDKALAAQRLNAHFDGIRGRISQAIAP